MITYKLAIIGFGNVGQGFVEVLQYKAELLRKNYGIRYVIVAVCDIEKGSAQNSNGLDPATLLKAVKQLGSLRKIPGHTDWDARSTIKESNADVILELSFTDLDTGEPAISHLREALKLGKHIVTSNKGPIALYYQDLTSLAYQQNVEIGYEGTVMSGTPVIGIGKEYLQFAGIQRIQGILNGTTNFMLCQMEKGLSYEAALYEAQQKGYAEADPTSDVEGYDTAAKIVILSNLFLNARLKMGDVHRTGIANLTQRDISKAKSNDMRWKLVGSIENEGDSLIASVKPVQLSYEHSLAQVYGVANSIIFDTELLGAITLKGPGAGRLSTGYALLSDLVAIHRNSVKAR